MLGNIIVDSRGHHHPLDNRENYEKRLENYLVGPKSVSAKHSTAIQSS